MDERVGPGRAGAGQPHLKSESSPNPTQPNTQKSVPIPNKIKPVPNPPLIGVGWVGFP